MFNDINHHKSHLDPHFFMLKNLFFLSFTGQDRVTPPPHRAVLGVGVQGRVVLRAERRVQRVGQSLQVAAGIAAHWGRPGECLGGGLPWIFILYP